MFHSSHISFCKQVCFNNHLKLPTEGWAQDKLLAVIRASCCQLECQQTVMPLIPTWSLHESVTPWVRGSAAAQLFNLEGEGHSVACISLPLLGWRWLQRLTFLQESGHWEPSTNGTTKNYPFSRILGTGEQNIMRVVHIPTDIALWAVCVSDVLQHVLRVVAVIAEPTQTGCGSSCDLSMGS